MKRIMMAHHGRRDLRESFVGLCEFARRHRPDWRFVTEDIIDLANPPRQLDGAILHSEEQPKRDWLHEKAIPCVSLTTRIQESHTPQLWMDEAAVGRLAAQHLHERGYRRYGWFGIQDHIGSQQRRAAFLQALEDLTGKPVELAVHVDHSGETDATKPDASYLAEALKQNPAAIGCFCYSDYRASHVVLSCDTLGLKVPHRIGILGADNYEFLCETLPCSLSSVDTDVRMRGFEAGRLLAKVIDCQPIEKPLPLLSPVGLVARGTTGFASTDDPLVDRAVAFIWANARKSINVTDVVDHCNTNRCTLSRRFRSVLGTTPHQQIQETRLEAIKDLLLTTSMDTESIADACGFTERSYLSLFFKKVTGETLIGFRKRSRGHAR
ncbi:MAG: helix-turn-helix domain-containing protein [Phycisphaera sp.]|nr:helix-turn-helix domain-containing protein [Phycisphaera sp.]